MQHVVSAPNFDLPLRLDLHKDDLGKFTDIIIIISFLDIYIWELL